MKRPTAYSMERLLKENRVLDFFESLYNFYIILIRYNSFDKSLHTCIFYLKVDFWKQFLKKSNPVEFNFLSLKE